MATEVVEVERVFEKLLGAVIEGAELSPDGCHLMLEDGRVLMFQGEFIIAVCRPSRKALH